MKITQRWDNSIAMPITVIVVGRSSGMPTVRGYPDELDKSRAILTQTCELVMY